MLMHSQVDIIKRGGHIANDLGYLHCVDAMQDVQHKDLLQRSIQSFLGDILFLSIPLVTSAICLLS